MTLLSISLVLLVTASIIELSSAQGLDASRPDDEVIEENLSNFITKMKAFDFTGNGRKEFTAQLDSLAKKNSIKHSVYRVAIYKEVQRQLYKANGKSPTTPRQVFVTKLFDVETRIYLETRKFTRDTHLMASKARALQDDLDTNRKNGNYQRKLVEIRNDLGSLLNKRIYAKLKKLQDQLQPLFVDGMNAIQKYGGTDVTAAQKAKIGQNLSLLLANYRFKLNDYFKLYNLLNAFVAGAKSKRYSRPADYSWLKANCPVFRANLDKLSDVQFRDFVYTVEESVRKCVNENDT